MTQSTHAYRADIDGLRAVAVVPVVLFHAGFAPFSGGYVGVDVFFVISGYLITSILASEIGQGQFSLANFYERRIRRLFPALFAMLIASAIAAWLLLLPQELEDFGESLALTTLFTSNFLFFSEAGYFDGPAELKPLLHTWSLAIEEQYYLLYPGFLLLLARYAGARFVAGTLVLLILSLTISVWSVRSAPDAAFYLLPSRTWELMLGSLLALLPTLAAPRWMREFGGLIGLAMIALAVFTFEHETPFPGLAALLPCVGTALLIATGAEGHTIVARALALKPIVGIGLISYSLYLWHWPLLVFGQHYFVRPLETTEAWALIAAAVLLAYLSWRYVERPFRGRSGWLSRPALFRAAGIAMLSLIGVGLYFDQSEGAPDRLPADVARVAAVAEDKAPERRRCEGIDPAELTYDRLCRLTEQDVPPTFVVWGDSHAMAIMSAFRAAANEAGAQGLNLTSNGCAPVLRISRPVRDLDAECPAFNATAFDLIAAHPEIETVILAARWARHAEGTAYGPETRGDLFIRFGEDTATNPAENRALFEDALSETLKALATLGRRVVVVGPIPEVGIDLPERMAKQTWRGVTQTPRLNRAAYEARQTHTLAMLRAASAEHGATFLDAASYFCDEVRCAILDEAGLPLYFDNNHLASSGAKRLIPLARGALLTATP